MTPTRRAAMAHDPSCEVERETYIEAIRWASIALNGDVHPTLSRAEVEQKARAALSLATDAAGLTGLAGVKQ